MKAHLLTFAAIAAVIAGSGAASAQGAGDYAPPRTSWGVPQLDGVWTNASLTQLQRVAHATAVVVASYDAATERELVQLRESGKVRAIGVSIHDRPRAGRPAVAAHPPDWPTSSAQPRPHHAVETVHAGNTGHDASQGR